MELTAEIASQVRALCFIVSAKDLNGPLKGRLS